MTLIPRRVVFIGDSGKAGQWAIPELLKRGYRILKVGLVDFPDPSASVLTLKTDFSDSGQVFNALTTHFGFDEYEHLNVPRLPDAVIHFAAYARNLLVPDNKCFQSNVIFEAVRRVLPADSRRFYADIYDLRISNVIEPHEYERDFPKYISEPLVRKRNAWSYVDARDLG